MRLASAQLLSALFVPATLTVAQVPFEPDYQYRAGEIAIPRAWPGEPTAESFSPRRALDYVEKGALAWARQRPCVSCHTAGTYLFVRSQLTSQFGPPAEEMRRFFVTRLALHEKEEPAWLTKGTNAEQVIYIAVGLAEYDAHVTRRLSEETERALKLMLKAQLPSGTWTSESCWPPLESSAFHAATLAARALAVAPGWLKTVTDPDLRQRIDSLRTYLRTTQPPHDYDRVSLLWTASRFPGLMSEVEKHRVVGVIRKRQHPDGGWSMRTFAEPEQWGNGGRAAQLRAEVDFDNPPSDGHMTGLALIALIESGVDPSEEPVRRGVAWLKANQRESGRWWTRSLNTDKWNFITYSGTAYPLLALALSRSL